jgi:hypothetical protein
MQGTNELDLDEWDKLIKIGNDYSQILFMFNETDRTLDRALDLIEGVGVRILKIEIFSSSQDKFKSALLQLKTQDVRHIVLRLIEEGFTKIKGYNALTN